MRRRLSAPSLWALFAAVAVGGVSLVAVALLSLHSYKQSADATLDAAQVYANAAVIFTELLESESAVRAYVATGDEAFLTPIQNAEATALTQLDQMQARTANDAAEQAAIVSLQAGVRDRFTDIHETLDLQKAGDHDAAVARIGARAGDSSREAVRTNLVDVIRVEGAQHQAARDTAATRANEVLAAILLLATVTAGLLGWMFWSIRHRGVEASLRASNQAKDEFLGLVSHELRTPLTVVLGNASLLTRHGERFSPEVREQSMREIMQESERLQRIVESMLFLSRLERGVAVELEPVLLEHALRRGIAQHRERYPGSKVEVELPPGLPPVLAHDTYLDQVIQNLLSNAEKYGARGGAIEVRAELHRGLVRVSVLDRGPGVESGRREQIFEPFVRLPGAEFLADGVGLGLPVCRRLMEVQHGELFVSPRPGGGAAFTFTLEALVPQEEYEPEAGVVAV